MEVFLWGETAVADVVGRNGRVRFRGTLQEVEEWLDQYDNLIYLRAKNFQKGQGLVRRLLHSVVRCLRLS